MTTVDKAITEYRTRHEWWRATRRRLVLAVLVASLAGDGLVLAVLAITGVNLLQH